MKIGIEQAILGSLLITPDCMTKVFDTVKPEMFKNKMYRAIYETIYKFFEQGTTIDMNLLGNELASNEEFGFTDKEWIEKLDFLYSLPVLSAKVEEYVSALIKQYQANELSIYLNKTEITDTNITEVMADIQTFIEKLKFNRKSNKISVKSLMEEMKECCFVDTEEQDGLKIGLKKLDNCIKLEKGEVTVIGARPAVGKSAFVTQIASNIAKQGLKIAYFNLEMNKKHIGQRLIARFSKISLARIINGKAFLEDEEERFNKALKELGGLNINVITGSLSDLDIMAECRFSNYDLVIIDYLQLIRSTRRCESRRVEVGYISRKIKELAMELDVPVILLSQLSRKSEYTQDREPTMADLRETGDIEQDASTIILMWNLSEDPELRSFKGIKVDKNRQGELIQECLIFEGENMNFIESAESLEEMKRSIDENSVPRPVKENDELPFN